MDGFLPIVLAVGATVGTLAVARIASRRLATLGFPAVQQQVQAGLRDLLEVERAKIGILEKENGELRRDNGELRQTLRDTRHDLDDCERQLDAERRR